MSDFPIHKDKAELFDVRVFFKNANANISYIIQSLSIKAYDSAGVDVTSTIVDTAASNHSSNQANVWLKAAGVAGKTYKVEVLATMTTGQKLMQRILLHVTD